MSACSAHWLGVLGFPSPHLAGASYSSGWSFQGHQLCRQGTLQFWAVNQRWTVWDEQWDFKIPSCWPCGAPALFLTVQTGGRPGAEGTGQNRQDIAVGSRRTGPGYNCLLRRQNMEFGKSFILLQGGSSQSNCDVTSVFPALCHGVSTRISWPPPVCGRSLPAVWLESPRKGLRGVCPPTERSTLGPCSWTRGSNI